VYVLCLNVLFNLLAVRISIEFGCNERNL